MSDSAERRWLHYVTSHNSNIQFMSSYTVQNSSGCTNHRSINHVCSLLLNKSLVSLASSTKRKESDSQNHTVVPIVCLVWGGHYQWLVWMGWVTLPTSDLPVIYLQGPMSLGHFSLSHSTLMFSNSTVIIPYSSLGAMTPQWVYRLTLGFSDSFFHLLLNSTGRRHFRWVKTHKRKLSSSTTTESCPCALSVCVCVK